MGWSQWSAREKCIILGAGLAMTGGVSMGLYRYRYYHNIACKLLAWRTKQLPLVKKAQMRIHLVESHQAWDSVFPQLLSEARREGAVGLDCEWTMKDGKRNPVALLQLATVSGLCVVVRLPYLHPNIPCSLKKFMEDESILKVGVEILMDSSYLADDHCLKVSGCIDLRYLAVQVEEGQKEKDEAEGQNGKTPKLGLQALTLRYLGFILSKNYRVRAGNWDAKILSKAQENYAARDALVGAQLLVVLTAQLLRDRRTNGVFSPPPLLPLLSPFNIWHTHLADSIRQVCIPYLDRRFIYSTKIKGGPPPGTSSASKNSLKSSNGDTTESQSINGGKVLKSKKLTLQRPLYNDCWLEAPDGMRLCTCDVGKAKWYVAKGLGQEISHDPLVVRLTFEPSGRPEPEGDSQYYVQERDNICVVCGTMNDLSRKSLVPHEYRCHFPILLKSHSSHDVVLLCPNCSHKADLTEISLRKSLVQECHPQSGPATQPRVAVDRNLKAVRNAAGALLRSRAQLPPARVQQLEEVVRNFFGEVTRATLEAGAELNTTLFNEDHVPHGLLVVQHYQKFSGLMALQQRWRTHFQTTLRPRHLPPLWSTSHGIAKFSSIAATLPPDHPDKLVYTSILTGTESTHL